MKFLVAILFTIFLSFIAGLYLPWWSIALVGFGAGALILQRPWLSLLASFLGGLILWSGLAWWIDSMNQSILSARIGELLGVGNHPMLLVLISGVVCGLVAGLGALSGSLLRTVRS